MDIYKSALKLKKQLEKQIRSDEMRLQKYPEGKLSICRVRNNFKWYQSFPSKGTERWHRNYIPKSNRNLAEKLAQKEFLKWRIAAARDELNAINMYIAAHEKARPSELKRLGDNIPYQELIHSDFLMPKGNAEWMSQKYEKNPIYAEERIHHTLASVDVRSKSEVVIANLLFSAGIPFHYEEVLHLGKETFMPDFTIKSPRDSSIYYWEHFGSMDNPNYLVKTISKIDSYMRAGMIPSKNLILTYETGDQPLDCNYADMLIHYYFL